MVQLTLKYLSYRIFLESNDKIVIVLTGLLGCISEQYRDKHVCGSLELPHWTDSGVSDQSNL